MPLVESNDLVGISCCIIELINLSGPCMDKVTPTTCIVGLIQSQRSKNTFITWIKYLLWTFQSCWNTQTDEEGESWSDSPVFLRSGTLSFLLKLPRSQLQHKTHRHLRRIHRLQQESLCLSNSWKKLWKWKKSQKLRKCRKTWLQLVCLKTWINSNSTAKRWTVGNYKNENIHGKIQSKAWFGTSWFQQWSPPQKWNCKILPCFIND